MARYCFYCGRELASNEKCNCRSHQGGQSAQPQKDQAKSPPSGGNSQASDSARQQNAGASQKQQDPRKQQKTAWQAPKFKKPVFTRPSFRKQTFNKTALLAFGQNIARYLARPVDTIRQAVQAADPRRLGTLLLLHAALGGVFALLLSQMGTLDLLLQLTVAGSADNPTLAAIFMAVQGFGLTLVFDLLLIVITHLSLRFIFRTEYPLIRVATSLSPVIFYQIVFSILALFSLSAVPISSLLTLAAGLAVSAIALYLALRQMTNYEENRCFMLAVFILLIYTSLISMLLSLAAPVINVLLDQTLPL